MKFLAKSPRLILKTKVSDCIKPPVSPSLCPDKPSSWPTWRLFVTRAPLTPPVLSPVYCYVRRGVSNTGEVLGADKRVALKARREGHNYTQEAFSPSRDSWHNFSSHVLCRPFPYPKTNDTKLKASSEYHRLLYPRHKEAR